MKSADNAEEKDGGASMTCIPKDDAMAAAVSSMQLEHLEYKNESEGTEASSSTTNSSIADRRRSSDILYDELPRALIATNVPHVIFEDTEKKKAFEDLFCAFGENVHFLHLSGLNRIRVGYEKPEQVVHARLGLHKKCIYGETISLFFIQPYKSSVNTTLQPPKLTKQHLLSPPVSPPVGWEPKKEAEPVIDYDVLAALANLAPGESHELHPAANNRPGIFVLPCEDPPSQGARMKIQHTRRPEPS